MEVIRKMKDAAEGWRQTVLKVADQVKARSRDALRQLPLLTQEYSGPKQKHTDTKLPVSKDDLDKFIQSLVERIEGRIRTLRDDLKLLERVN